MKRPIVIAVSIVAVLGLMSWVVDTRLGGIKMPMDEMKGVAGLSVRPGVDLKKLSVAGAVGELPVLADAMPEFQGISQWLNGEPRTAAGLKGKVVLIDFWTYSCINCIRTMPYVTAWHDTYADQGFTVIGVHTPEFAFEKVPKNVKDAIERHKIAYPVALDNDYGTWNAYANRYWPAHYLFDAQGRLRMVHFGEGKYKETEAAIRALLVEAGNMTADVAPVVAAEPALARAGSHETYVGYGRQENFESPEAVRRDAVAAYTEPGSLSLDGFSLSGRWKIEAERAVLDSDTGTIAFRYSATKANLVLGAAEEVVAEVTLDGVPVPPGYRSIDTYEQDGKTYIKIQAERLYELTDGHGIPGVHTVRLRFLTPGVSAYAFTFG